MLGQFPYSETALSPTLSRMVFDHGKLEDYVLDVFYLDKTTISSI